MPREKRPLPKYRNSYPEHLATQQELNAEGLRPGRSEPDALLEYVHGDRHGTCGLHERAAAVPLDRPPPA